jgi:hemerythrin-like metal-binding protein
MDREGGSDPILLVERDHKILMERWKALTMALENSGDRGLVRDCIRGLIACAREHFRNEEWAMREIAFPGYLKHQADHARLLKEAEDMLRNFDGAFQHEDWPALAAFFRHWISRHHDKHDKALQGFVRQLKTGA